jgi:hypothetical protein
MGNPVQWLELTDLVGVNLDGFVIQEMIELFNSDQNGCFQKSVGVLMDANVAQVLKKQYGPVFHRVRSVLVLTSSTGNVGIVVNDCREVTVMDDDKLRQDLREKILAGLTPEERDIITPAEDI